MSLVAAWLLFPALLLAVATGCGLLVERLLGRPLPGALVPVTGLSLIVVVGQFLTLGSATAPLTAPLVVSLAVAGFVTGWRELEWTGLARRLDGWALGAMAAAFALFAAPIVLSGEATFAGYIKLDDTATWMTLTDRVIEHGRSLEGLAPSSYEATLAFNLGDGYPVGVFLPLGVVTLLSGQDIAWTIQPYMASLGALLALALWQIAASVIASRPLRALAALAGSQSALLFGYYLWGGVKEIAASALIASAVALAAFAVERRGDLRSLVPVGLLSAGLIGVLSAGGALWLALPLAGAVVLLAAGVGGRTAAIRATWCAGIVAVLSLPVLLAGGVLPPTASPLAGADARGNLFEALDPAQVAGIWPAGDFRVDPADRLSAYLLIAIAVSAAVGVAVFAWRRRAWSMPLYVGGSLSACLVIYALGSPWVDAKALATASPAIPFAAALAGAALYARGLRVEGALLLVAVLGGVLWSNIAQYRDVSLAPRDQLAELEEIGEMIEGRGPTLMTEYQPYGVRHFLRDADPEAASELRRRRIPLLGGRSLPKGEYADIDRFRPGDVLAYRTLVLRRGPEASRPSSAYALAWRGDFYEVWQRSDDPPPASLDHLGLGDHGNPVARPSCADVRELAARTPRSSALVAAARPPTKVLPLAEAEYPAAWRGDASADRPIPTGPGEVRAKLEVSRDADYEVWLRGSVRPRVELLVDGDPVGSVRHQLNNDGLYVRLGQASLGAGAHELSVRFEGADLHPGSAGRAEPIGPLVLSDSDPAEARIVHVRLEDAERRLCGASWDWIEAVS